MSSLRLSQSALRLKLTSTARNPKFQSTSIHRPAPHGLRLSSSATSQLARRHAQVAPAPAHTSGDSDSDVRTVARPGKPVVPYASRIKDGRAVALDVWSIFHASNLPEDCINLGQGYMNFPPPTWARRAAQEALQSVDGNHYAPPKGRPRLRNAIKQFYGTEFGKELDAESEIVVTSGANEAQPGLVLTRDVRSYGTGQYAAFTAFVEPGDEVIVFEPFFDQYLASIVFQGGKCVYVPLHPSWEPAPGMRSGKRSWTVDFDELRSAVTPRTKMIVLNSPHNPLGKVFSRAEMEQVAQIAEDHNLLVMSDEVYEGLVYDGREHVRFATLPGMWNRTLTVGSAAKLFAATGWRVGWVIGPPALLAPVLAASTRIVFCSNTPLQEGAAAALEEARPRRFLERQLAEYAQRRSVLVGAFEQLGMEYAWPEGSYYILLDISRVRWPEDYPFPPHVESRGRCFKAAWFLANEIKVSCIPVSDFYCDAHKPIGENYARFAFCKDLDTLRAAAERLQRLRDYLA
ncbi:PLP-dependent transferase [Daedaleopsis nitida]|nr:PLP-dependent transferase [Daedaleopsis nitida]